MPDRSACHRADEHDHPSEQVSVRKTKSGDLLVAGSMGVGDLEIHANVALPEGRYETVAGFVIHALGRFPKVGEIVEFKGIRIRVESASNNRITLVRIIRPKNGNGSRLLSSNSSESSVALADSNREVEEKPLPARASNIG